MRKRSGERYNLMADFGGSQILPKSLWALRMFPLASNPHTKIPTTPTRV